MNVSRSESGGCCHSFRRLTGLVLGISGFFLVVSSPLAQAQFFDGGLNPFRSRDESPRPPGATPDVTFIRSQGIPKPRSVAISTLKGYEVSFYISAETDPPGKLVDFIIRDFPSAGRIVSQISDQKRRNAAKVTYYADPNSAATMDSFTFAARYPGGKISQLARCEIRIQDVKADIEVTNEVDFGELMVGEKAEREIIIKNSGIGPFTTRLNLFSPWKVISPADGNLNVGPGRQAIVRIGFEPTFAGPASYHLPLSRSEKGTCKLSGVANKPFELASEEWELKFNPETKRREVDVIILNKNERPIEAYLRTSSRLKMDSSEYTVLLPGRENRIKVYLEIDDVISFDGGLQIKLREGYSETAKVFSATLPARMEIEVPDQIGHDVINFGKVTAGRSTERGILVKNMGGELMLLDAHVPEPFRILTKTDRQLIPLESFALSVGFYPHKDDRGAADETMTLVANQQEIRIRLVGNALRPANAPREPIVLTPAPAPAPATNAPGPSQPDTPPQTPAGPDTVGNGSSNMVKLGNRNSPDRIRESIPPEDSVGALSRRNPIRDGKTPFSMSPIGILTRELVKRERAPGLDCPEDFELVRATAKTLEFGFTAPKNSELETFVTEVRGQRINPITSMPESVWAPYPDVSYSRVGRLVKARVSELSPYSIYEFRVFTIDANGRSSPPSSAFGARTTRTMDWTYIYLGTGILFLGWLVWAIRKIIIARRGEVYQTQYV